MGTHKHTQTDTLSLSLSLLYTQRAHHVPACLTCRDEAKVHTIGNAKVGKSAIVSGEHLATRINLAWKWSGTG